MKKKIFAAALAGLMVISMAAGCSKKPVVTLGQYKGMELTDVTQAEVEAEMEAVLESYAELVEVDRAAVDGDTVNINYVGTLDGVAFEGGTNDSEEGADIVLGSDSLIDGFEDGLIGTTAGQTLDLNLTFPDPYENNPDMSGKAVVFTVTVNAVKESQTPELTDEFVTENFPEYGTTVDDLWEALREEMRMTTLYEQITTKLLESCTVENLPKDEIETEAQAMVDYYVSYCEYLGSMYGMDVETVLYYFMNLDSMEALEEFANTYAEDDVKNTLILKEIAAKENLTVTDEIYAERIDQLALDNGYEDAAALEEAYPKEEIEEVMLLNVTMEFIIDEAVIQ